MSVSATERERERGGGRQGKTSGRACERRGGVLIKQKDNSSCKTKQENKDGYASIFEPRAPLSGRCLNKGAPRAASADPSSSTGQERSSWSIWNKESHSFEQKQHRGGKRVYDATVM